MEKSGIRLIVVVGALLSMACATTGRLGGPELQGGRLAAVMKAPPRAEVFTGSTVWIDAHEAAGAALRAARSIAERSRIQRERERMEQALGRAELPERIRRRILERGSRILGCDPVERPEQSDAFFDLQIRRYGIDADPFSPELRFLIDVRVHLRDTRTGRGIWRTAIRSSGPVSPSTFGLEELGFDALPLLVLEELSADEIEGGLKRLADEAADRICLRLQEAFRKSQPGR